MSLFRVRVRVRDRDWDWDRVRVRVRVRVRIRVKYRCYPFFLFDSGFLLLSQCKCQGYPQS